MRKGKVGLAAVAVFCGMALAACGGSTNTVDGKAVVEVPATENNAGSLCYMLEIDQDSAGGQEVSEGYWCVSKPEFDKNRVGEPWVDAQGKKK